MKKEVLIALISSMVEDALTDIQVTSGARGIRGPRGQDGNNFQLIDHAEEIKNFVYENRLRFIDLTAEEQDSLRGKDGKDFVFEEHKEEVEAILEKIKLKFSDFTDEEKELLRGPKGKHGVDGKDGADGKDFIFEEHLAKIDALVSNHKLKFSDLTDEEKESLRGYKGKDGKDGPSGQDFIFDSHVDSISSIIFSFIRNNHSLFELKFSALSEEEKAILRGPRGQRGKQGEIGVSGKSFDFEENRINISALIPEHSEDLKLKFAHLTAEDKEQLKLKFCDLSESDKLTLKGARGQRGKQGINGRDGKDFVFEEHKNEINKLVEIHKLKFSDLTKEEQLSLKGKIGPRGIPGIQGVKGRDGFNGKNGSDASEISEISIEQVGNDIYFVFDFTDGTTLKTNTVTLPKGSGGGGGGGGGGGASTLIEYPTSIYDEGVLIAAIKKINFIGDGVLASLNGDTVDVTIPGGGGGGITGISVLDDNVLVAETTKLDFLGDNIHVVQEGDRVKISVDEATASPVAVLDEGTVVCSNLASMNFVGDGVRVTTNAMMSDWDLLSNVPALDSYSGPGVSSVTVTIESTPDSTLLKDVPCDASVYVKAAVRMQNNGIAVNAMADTYANSNVLGFCESKSSDVLCNIRVSGFTLDIFTDLDTTYDYFLSATVPGGISYLVPVTGSNFIKLKLGQAFSALSFLISKGERVVRP